MISFILTVLNRPDMLSRFFQILPQQSMDHEWILVDNASEKTTRQLEVWLRDNIPNVRVIENYRNEGFGMGNNIGASDSCGDVLVFTQPDVVFNGDVTVHLALHDGTLYGHQYLNLDTGWNRFGNIVIPYLTGYFLACTRGTWNTLGGFDPIYYPADFEDVDLSYSAVRKGMSLVSLDVPISHAQFGSTWSQFSDRESVTRMNRSKFARKWGL